MFIQHENTRLYADLHGQPVDRQALALLLHGLGGSSASWQDLPAGLARTRQVLVPDLRGCGRSERGSGPLDLARMTGDVLALLDELGAPACHVAGHSLGGVIGQELLSRHGRRVLSAVLVSTSSRVGDKAAANWQRLADRVESEGLGLMAEGTARGFSDDYAAANPDTVAHHRRLTEQSDARVWAEMARAAAVYDYDEALVGVGQPVLVLQGGADRLTPTGGSVLLSRALGGSTLEIVEGKGHQLPIEMGEAFVQRIEEFFSTAKIVA